MKLLSIVVPCYNSEDYLENCIESLLPGGEQLEIIIIDDGSTDSTGDIADRYAHNHPDIVKVVHQPNGGHGAGINQGVKHASGIYFKVVDSDDTLSADLPAFIERLKECDEEGGVDLFLTNYYYVHSDGRGDRPVSYSDVLPEGRIFSWAETGRFRPWQLLTIHSCTFRTRLLKEKELTLPKHIYYEDNLMVTGHLAPVRRLYYMDADLYRYSIGREGQSVQDEILKKRYAHQLIVAARCLKACDPGSIKDRKQKRYIMHELFMMLGMGVVFARLNGTDQADSDVKKMWQICRKANPKYAFYFHYLTPLFLLCIPGHFGRSFCSAVYTTAHRIVRFN